MILQLEINSFSPLFFLEGPEPRCIFQCDFKSSEGLGWDSHVKIRCLLSLNAIKNLIYWKINSTFWNIGHPYRFPFQQGPLLSHLIKVWLREAVYSLPGDSIGIWAMTLVSMKYDLGGLISRLWELANFKCSRCVIAAFRNETWTTFTCNAVLFCAFLMLSLHPNSIEHLLGAHAPSPLPLWPVRDGWLVSLPGPRPGVEQLGKTVVGGR